MLDEIYRLSASGEEQVTANNILSFLPTFDAEITEINIGREKRNYLLLSTDYLLLTDNPAKLTAQQIEKFEIYRQQLRDLPAVEGFPNIDWPTIPE